MPKPTTDARDDRGLPDVIYAQASPRSIGGTSLFDAGVTVDAGNVVSFFSDAATVERAVVRLQEAGFEVLQVARTTINIAGAAAVYERAFATKLFSEERLTALGDGTERNVTLVRAQDGERPGLIDTRPSSLGDVVEGIAIEEPVILFEHAFAPPVKYWHLDVPGDVSLALDADRAHRAGVTGRDVHVVMVDTGWYAHPFFTQRGYRVDPVVLGPGAANPAADEVGHGTAASANVFAAAPDVRFTMVKQGIANATAAFNAAVALRPDIISCSWGFDIERGPLTGANQALAAAVATAVAGGIVVVFSAGNGHFGFPGQHPDVISAGGVYMGADGATNASDYASGFASQVYPGRNVPDVSGLVGMQPRAAYIMLPVQPGDQIDANLAGGTHPAADETAADDGWAAISGTSAAAPQIAGVCALLKQACPKLTPAEIKAVLVSSARDVTAGACSARTGGHKAISGRDLATGSGLVDAQKAVLMATARCAGDGGTPPADRVGPLDPPMMSTAELAHLKEHGLLGERRGKPS
jgi:subtilisin family serine protease